MTYPPLALHIGGRWLDRASGGERPVINPADESVLAMLPLAGENELETAAVSARRGLAQWRRLSALERFTILRRGTDRMRERAADIARILTLEQGKPLAEAQREVMLSADIIDFQAEETPGSCIAMVRCLLDGGVPPDALNLVCGEPAQVSAMLIAHEAVAKVSFTGSVAVGRQLGELCARKLKRYTPELGGHAPVIVCEDADLGFALKTSVGAKFRNAGQVCASPIRFLVHRRHFGAWCDGFVRAASALRLGPGLDPQTQMGPLAHARRLDDIASLVADARSHGAQLLCGGQRVERPGYFFEPTVLSGVPAASRLAHTEPFGPVATIDAFDSLDEAIARANDSRYGLGAYAFTRDLATAHRLADEIDAGMVGINHFGVSQPEMPFGGWKESGHGQEMGAEGLLAYTELKTVIVGMPA